MFDGPVEYRFADCVLDCARHRLFRAGREVHVEPQVFALLALLARRAGEVVPRDEIVQAVWGGRIVSEATISARISAARAAVGDDGRQQRVIRTVTRVGLQLVAETSCNGASPQDGPPPGVPNGAAPDIRIAQSADGTGIAWEVTGAGPPLLRAGHWLSHLELDWRSPVWRPLLDRLARRHRLACYDQRGTGLSEWACGPLTLDAFVDDMAAVADAAGLDRFAIHAVSQSVPVAIAFAVRHPERVSRMVLISGFVQGSVVRDRAEGQQITETFLKLIEGGWGQPGSAFIRAFTTLFMPDGTPEQIESFTRMQLESATPARAVELRRAIGKFDIGDLLGQVRCPVLVGHGHGDSVQPFAQGQSLARGLPDARFMAFDSRNHIALPQDPEWDRMLAAAEAFLARAAD
ncbi:alpha/beta fold hydrolase [Roseovarius salinarum]|uniref:alpha/beta fold hydrolase n=1 Tax=Roseovarius salinarum TaxID=1981892 RepID=UPI0012FFD674|nr:alpha/beta fold hydrolase [Roseovarius salinarum]